MENTKLKCNKCEKQPDVLVDILSIKDSGTCSDCSYVDPTIVKAAVEKDINNCIREGVKKAGIRNRIQDWELKAWSPMGTAEEYMDWVKDEDTILVPTGPNQPVRMNHFVFERKVKGSSYRSWVYMAVCKTFTNDKNGKIKPTYRVSYRYADDSSQMFYKFIFRDRRADSINVRAILREQCAGLQKMGLREIK